MDSSGSISTPWTTARTLPDITTPTPAITSPAQRQHGRFHSTRDAATWQPVSRTKEIWRGPSNCIARSLAAGGPSPEICFQLAELLYRLGDVTAARERYYMAIELDEDYVEARANLGCVLAETGQLELAVAAFQGALRYHSDYPDVHYHLARTLDDLGRHGAKRNITGASFCCWLPTVPGRTKPGTGWGRKTSRKAGSLRIAAVRRPRSQTCRTRSESTEQR